MAENKKSIIVYADWMEHFENLTDDEAGKLIKHFFRYVNDLKPQPQDRLIEIAFAPIKASLKRDLDKWEKTVQERSINGRLGNIKKYHIDLFNQIQSNAITLEEAEEIAKTRKASPPDSVATKTVAKVADSVNDNVNVNDIYYKELLISESWIEINAKNNRTTPDKVKAYLTKFNNNLIAQGEKKHNKKEYQSHFARWLPIELAKEVKDKPKFTPLI